MKCVNVAHAGYGGYMPNSWASIWGIKESTCDVLEMDVRREGSRIYLSHEFRGDSSGCVGLEEAFIYLRENAPEKQVGIDLKEPIFEEVQKLVEYSGMDGKIIYSGSFFLGDLQKNRGKNRVFYNLENSIENSGKLGEEMPELPKLFELLKQYGADGVNMDYRLFSKNMAAMLAEKNLVGAVWTVDSKEDMKHMLKLGAGSITTRYPGDLAQIIQER